MNDNSFPKATNQDWDANQVDPLTRAAAVGDGVIQGDVVRTPLGIGDLHHQLQVVVAVLESIAEELGTLNASIERLEQRFPSFRLPSLRRF